MLEEPTLGEALVKGGSGTVITLVTILTDEAPTVVRALAGAVVVVVDVVVVVVLDVVEVVREDARGGAEWCSGVEPDDAVSVKTRTKRRTGLDHITQ